VVSRGCAGITSGRAADSPGIAERGSCPGSCVAALPTGTASKRGVVAGEVFPTVGSGAVCTCAGAGGLSLVRGNSSPGRIGGKAISARELGGAAPVCGRGPTSCASSGLAGGVGAAAVVGSGDGAGLNSRVAGGSGAGAAAEASAVLTNAADLTIGTATLGGTAALTGVAAVAGAGATAGADTVAGATDFGWTEGINGAAARAGAETIGGTELIGGAETIGGAEALAGAGAIAGAETIGETDFAVAASSDLDELSSPRAAVGKVG